MKANNPTNEFDFTQIVSTTKRVVLASIFRYLNPKLADSIDDVAQEVYLKMYKSIAKHGINKDKYSSIGNWAYTIAKNESIRFNLKVFRHDEKVEFLKENFQEDDISFENSIIDRMEYEEILKSLPESHKKVVELTIEGKSGKEISLELNIAPGTVKSRLSRARSILNEKFKIKI